MRECIRVMTIKHLLSLRWGRARERELCILQSYSYNHLLSLTIILQFTMRKLKLNETCMFGCVCVCEYNSYYSYFDFGVKSSPSLTLWIGLMRTCVFLWLFCRSSQSIDRTISPRIQCKTMQFIFTIAYVFFVVFNSWWSKRTNKSTKERTIAQHLFEFVNIFVLIHFVRFTIYK